MLEKLQRTIEKYGMFQKGDGIVVGVSGGPDSICLLHLLWRIRDEYGLRLYAVHLNHQFRGDEAAADAEYVKKFCDQLKIPAFLFSEDVSLYSKKRGITFEEAGREIRYRFFDQVMKDMKASKIAIAQNMDDQAETVLMRLMRGSGIEGLSAIEYIRDDKIIRPLLDVSRKEIDGYCDTYQLMPRIDKTNLESIYTRNRIRLELLPYIEKYFNPNIKNTLSRTANLLREDKDFIRGVVDKVYGNTVKNNNGEIIIQRKTFLESHHVIRKRILREVIRNLKGDLINLESKHVEQLMDFIEKGRVGTAVNLPGDMEALLDYSGLVIRWKKRLPESTSFEYNVNIGETIDIGELNGLLSSTIIDMEIPKEMEKENNRKYFDLDKIQNTITLRNRRTGDRFSPFGMKGSKKLKDYFIDEKISREMREKIPLLCDGNEIIWVIGYRISEKYKVDPDTKRVLKVTYDKINL